MKKIILLSILCLYFPKNTFSQERHFSLESYGYVVYQHFDYGPNQKATPLGSLKDSRAIIDVPKFVLAPEFYFSPDLFVDCEIEFEHLGAGSSLELEYEEFGEYEFESEKGGEVEVEELHIDKLFSDAFNLRVGRFPIALTLFNDRHRPLSFFATSIPESESEILPSVWAETGIEIFGSAFNFSYNLDLVNGLDASGFSSERWIAKGYQTRFELVKATNLATVARLDYEGIQNTLIGASLYYGNSADNRPKPEDMKGVDANVSIVSLHGQYKSDQIILRGDYIYGNLENSAIVSQVNASLSVNTQSPRSPVAKNALAWYAEGGYNIAPLIDLQDIYKVFPFIRYEYYNTMQDVEPGIFANPRFKRSIFTFGLNLMWNDEIIFKADYSTRRVGDGKFNTENTLGLSVGYNTTFIK
jgi:hypothetical protein